MMRIITNNPEQVEVRDYNRKQSVTISYNLTKSNKIPDALPLWESGHLNWAAAAQTPI